MHVCSAELVLNSPSGRRIGFAISSHAKNVAESSARLAVFQMACSNDWSIMMSLITMLGIDSCDRRRILVRDLLKRYE